MTTSGPSETSFSGLAVRVRRQSGASERRDYKVERDLKILTPSFAADQWNSPPYGGFHSARSACIVSTRAARAAGTNDANTADTTTTPAAPINGIGPGS
jgi:hypothetical protein